MNFEYDLIVLGGGVAGFAAAYRRNLLKKKTMLINDPPTLPLGGTCVNVGCLPTKIMLHQGSQYFYAIHSPFESIDVKGQIDFLLALHETNEVVEELRQRNYECYRKTGS
ncbi:MAG: FAD-dependent oxidoreductase [Candidatus Ranarchaeia archaeon]